MCFGIDLLLVFFIFLAPLSGEVRVQADVDPTNHFENLTVPVTIIVTHPANVSVDESSFVLGNERIQPEKVQVVGDPNGKEDILSIYHYDVPAMPKGLHLLPAVSVRINNKVYKSVASTFEVKAMNNPSVDTNTNTNATVSSSSTTSSGAFLKIENVVDGSITLFPGQLLTLGYRYSFNANIETTEENTPLFDPKGFVKVGDKVVDNKQNGSVSFLTVTQKFQAEAPGVYTVGPSNVEGYLYTEDSAGRRTYDKNKLKSVAPPITLTIKPLPADNKPASFNGAVGKYTFSVSLKTPSTVTVGDAMSLQVQISGQGNLESIQLPELCCQPGMSGVFKLSDLPPVGKVEGTSKRFTVELRPLTANVKAIPSLEFSSFNPGTGAYEVLHSPEIPINVSELKVPSTEKPEVKQEGKPAWHQAMDNPQPVDVGSNYSLSAEDLENLLFGSWWMLLLVPCSIFFLIYQNNLKRFTSEQKVETIAASSERVYEEAYATTPQTPAFYAKLYEAFFLRLKERGSLDNSVHSVDELPSEGAAGDVKALLLDLEESRYAGDKGKKETLLLEQARKLFNELGEKK